MPVLPKRNAICQFRCRVPLALQWRCSIRKRTVGFTDPGAKHKLAYLHRRSRSTCHPTKRYAVHIVGMFREGLNQSAVSRIPKANSHTFIPFCFSEKVLQQFPEGGSITAAA